MASIVYAIAYRVGHHLQHSWENQLSLVPKEQPPRKLSGPRTVVDTKTLERGPHDGSAEGIAFSGNRTEEASPAKALRLGGTVVPDDMHISDRQ